MGLPPIAHCLSNELTHAVLTPWWSWLSSFFRSLTSLLCRGACCPMFFCCFCNIVLCDCKLGRALLMNHSCLQGIKECKHIRNRNDTIPEIYFLQCQCMITIAWQQWIPLYSRLQWVRYSLCPQQQFQLCDTGAVAWLNHPTIFQIQWLQCCLCVQVQGWQYNLSCCSVCLASLSLTST